MSKYLSVLLLVAFSLIVPLSAADKVYTSADKIMEDDTEAAGKIAIINATFLSFDQDGVGGDGNTAMFVVNDIGILLNCRDVDSNAVKKYQRTIAENSKVQVKFTIEKSSIVKGTRVINGWLTSFTKR